MGEFLIEIKEDSAEKLAAMAGKETKFFLMAGEFNNIVKAVNSAKVIEIGQMLVYKKLLKTDPNYLIGQQVGDYCEGFVYDENGNLEKINADYLGGDATLKSSYDI